MLTAPRALSFSLTCPGHNIVSIRTTPPLAGISDYCDDGSITDWVNVPASDTGHPIHLRITASPGTRWLLRIDGSKTTHPNH